MDLTAIEPDRLAEFKQLAGRKLAELRATTELKQAGRNTDALALVASGAGTAAMDAIGARFDNLIVSQNERTQDRLNWARDVGERLRYGALAALLLAAVLAYIAVEQFLPPPATISSPFATTLWRRTRQPSPAMSTGSS